MTPFFFGPPERQLFGAYHPGEPSRAKGLAVLLCNPFGQEAIRTHRLFRVVADRLSRSGAHVLRFDYYGTGDSGGNDDAGELIGWRRDLLSAHAELMRLSGATSVVWLGARLGGTLALGASDAAGAALRRLVLWDPIVDGGAYSELLRIKHVERLEEVFLRADPSWRRRLAEDPQAFTGEASGFPVAAEFHAQLRALNLRNVTLPAGLELDVIADPADGAVQQWVSALVQGGTTVRMHPLPRALEWNEHEAAHGALVPAAALQALLATVGS